MSDDVRAAATLIRVTLCVDEATLAAASELFDRYRSHYGAATVDGQTASGWLTGMIRDGKLRVWIASTVDGTPVGVATSHEIPASLALGHFWQLRDLFVDVEFRRQGVAAALVSAVRSAAEVAGARRLSLTTEQENAGAIALYERLGFKHVVGLTALSRNLVPDAVS